MDISSFRLLTYTVISLVNIVGFSLNSYLNLVAYREPPFADDTKLFVFVVSAVTLTMPFLVLLERFRPTFVMFKPPAEITWLCILLGLHSAACFFIFKLHIPAQCQDLHNSETRSFSVCAEVNAVRVTLFLDAVLLLIAAVTVWTWSIIESSHSQSHVWSTPISLYRREHWNQEDDNQLGVMAKGVAFGGMEGKGVAYHVEFSPSRQQSISNSRRQSVAKPPLEPTSRPTTSRRSSYARADQRHSRRSAEHSRFNGTESRSRSHSQSHSRPRESRSQPGSRPTSRPTSRSGTAATMRPGPGVSPSRPGTGSTVIVSRPTTGRPDTGASQKSRRSMSFERERSRPVASDTLWSSQIRPDDPFGATKFAFAIPASAPSSLSKLYNNSEEFAFSTPAKPKRTSSIADEGDDVATTMIAEASSSRSSVHHEVPPPKYTKTPVTPKSATAARPGTAESGVSVQRTSSTKSSNRNSTGPPDKAVPTSYRFIPPSVIYENQMHTNSTPEVNSARARPPLRRSSSSSRNVARQESQS